MPSNKDTLQCNTCPFHILNSCAGVDKDELCAAVTMPSVITCSSENQKPSTSGGLPQASECPLCKGTGRVVASGGEGSETFNPCICRILVKLREYLRPLGVFHGIGYKINNNLTTIPAITIPIHNFLSENLSHTSIDKENILILSDRKDRESILSVLVFLLLKQVKKESYAFLNLYELLQILLKEGKISEKYPSLFDIRENLLIITIGMDELNNKLYPQILSQVITRRAFTGQRIWIYSTVPMSNFPGVSEVKQGIWRTISIPSTSSSESKPEVSVTTKKIDRKDLI